MAFPFFKRISLWGLLWLAIPLFAEEIQFKADLYQRDMQNNTVFGKGKAWLKKGDREIWADEISVDMAKRRATANGHVHMRERDVDIYASHASQNLDNEDAVLENATVALGRMVMTGQIIQRFSKDRYDISEGSYTNCNSDEHKDPDLGVCTYDWKVYGRHFSITFEEYAHIHDALVSVKGIPVFYTPYFLIPVKSRRQSGLLMTTFSYSQNLGNGMSVPYFQVLGSWHDLTIVPSFYTRAGFHLGMDYRYVYSPSKRGDFNVSLLQRRFSRDRPTDPPVDDESRARAFGLIGEWSIDAWNVYSLGGRAHSRQIFRFVSDPYYTRDHAMDIRKNTEWPSLRSQISVTVPGDRSLFTAEVVHFQNLVIPKDRGIDQGGITQLPSLLYSRPTSPLLYRLFQYEVDTQFINYYRPQSSFDPVPAVINTSSPFHQDPDPNYHAGDYIRTGRRLRLEPRLVTTLPMPPGFRLQPILKVGMSMYHFDLPQSAAVHRDYMHLEAPFSLYLSRRFETGISGYEKLAHVLQPRAIYGVSLYDELSDNHPFFYEDAARGLSNPRFDIYDYPFPFEYVRFEMINRVLRKAGDSSDRFFLLQLSEQYNFRTSPVDPRFSRRLGPIEVLGELRLWRFALQAQANYQLETVIRGGEETRENDFSGTLEYSDPEGDRFRLINRHKIKADPVLTEKTVGLGWYKRLPLLFDVEGDMEYSYKRGDLVRYRLGFVFGAKGGACWGLTLSVGRDDFKQGFVRALFRLDFGMSGVGSRFTQGT